MYLDDILIFSRTLEDHFSHLQKVVQRIKEANLKLKPSKCHFLHQEIDYLGHVISAKGLKPNPKLTEVVQQFPVPKDIKGVGQFLGLDWIPVDRIFQIFRVDVVDLPKTDRGNQHVVVFQDFLSKWPFVFPLPDQKAITYFGETLH